MDSFDPDATSPDDNAFYEELTRQILMLTYEDDNDDKVTYSNSLRHTAMVYGGVKSRPVTSNYYSWSETDRGLVPSWMQSLWAKSGVGTGVFIPSGTATLGHSKKSGRRRRYNNNKATKKNDRGRVYSSAGQKIHG